MTVVRIGLKSGADYVEMSEARQKRIADAQRLGTADGTAQAQALYNAITEMGLWDRLTDNLLHDGAKQKMLETIATLSLATHAARASVGHGDALDDAELLRAQEALLSQLSPHGLRLFLADPRRVSRSDGYQFVPDTESKIINSLLTLTLPYKTAGKFLEQAGMFAHAALAFQHAADSARSSGDLTEASELLDKEADLWSKIGSDFRAYDARRLRAETMQQIVTALDGFPEEAALAAEAEAEVWASLFEFQREATARMAARQLWMKAAREKEGTNASTFKKNASLARIAQMTAIENFTRQKHINDRLDERMRIFGVRGHAFV